MGISRAADLYYTFRFIKVLVTPWKEMDAFEHGVIDENGKNLIRFKDLKTVQEKDSYTTFHRLVFNIKRILEKVPFGKSKIASYAAALFLLREETGMSEDAIIKALEELNVEFDDIGVIEEDMHTPWPGDYILQDSIENNYIVKLENTDPVGVFAGVDIYKSVEGIYITKRNIIY